MDNTLRVFRDSDAGGVRNLILNILSKEYPFDKSAYSDSDLYKIRETYGGKREAFFVIEAAGKIVGTVGVKEENPSEALLRRLFVDPKYRKKGYGSGLLSKAVDFCKTKGYKAMHFRCTDRMSEAMHLCLKKGFKETEKLEVSGFKIHRLELTLL